MVAGFIGRAHLVRLAAATLGVGAVLSAAGALLFVFSLWRTLDTAPEPPKELVTMVRHSGGRRG